MRAVVACRLFPFPLAICGLLAPTVVSTLPLPLLSDLFYHSTSKPSSTTIPLQLPSTHESLPLSSFLLPRPSPPRVLSSFCRSLLPVARPVSRGASHLAPLAHFLFASANSIYLPLPSCRPHPLLQLILLVHWRRSIHPFDLVSTCQCHW